MQSFNERVRDVLHKRGSLELRFLVRTARRGTAIKKTDEALMEAILVSALNGKRGSR